MTIDGNSIVQALTVTGLLGTAGVLWDTVKKVIELGVVVKTHDKRIDRLEEEE